MTALIPTTCILRVVASPEQAIGQGNPAGWLAEALMYVVCFTSHLFAVLCRL